MRKALLFGAVAVGAFAAGMFFWPTVEAWAESSRAERYKARKES